MQREKNNFFIIDSMERVPYSGNMESKKTHIFFCTIWNAFHIGIGKEYDGLTLGILEACTGVTERVSLYKSNYL